MTNSLTGLYYLIFKKHYKKSENIWESTSTIIDLRKIIGFFHQKHLEKPIATFLAIYFT